MTNHIHGINPSRINKDHFLMTKQIAHRAICRQGLVEHSERAIIECVENGIVPEIDVTAYKGELILYHNDSPSSMLGQDRSSGIKSDIVSAISLEYVLFNVIRGRIEVVIDLKVVKKDNLKQVLKLLETYSKIYGPKFVVQTYNPIHLRYISSHYPEYIIGIVGHSLSGLGRFQKPTRIIVNFLLFHNIKKDYVVYNLDPYVFLFVKLSNIMGFPVLGYAPKTKSEAKRYTGIFVNFIGEGAFFEV